MDTFLPRLRSCSYNRNQICNNLDNKSEKEEVQDTNKDIRKKTHSDKASYNIINTNASCQQQNLLCNGFGEIEQQQKETDLTYNKQRTSSVGRRRMMQRLDANSNSKQLFRMLSSQKSQEVKSIETQRTKIQDRIHQRNNTTTNNDNSLINGGNNNKTNQTLNSMMRNSLLKYPHQVAPQNQNSIQQLNNQQQNYFCQDDLIKCNINNNSNTTTTANHENVDQVYQYYTGFENESSNNQQCPPISKNNPHKNFIYEGKTTGKQQEMGSYNEFIPEFTSNQAYKAEINSTSTASSRNETESGSQQLCSSLPSQRYHQHKFIASVERSNQNKILNENTPPRDTQFYENIQQNSCSKTKIQKNNQHTRSISQNYHLYNPNAACIKIINNNNNNNSNNLNQQTSTASVSPSAQANNTAAGVFFSSKLQLNNQIVTQTLALQDSIEMGLQQNYISKRVTISGNNEMQTNYMNINDPSCERSNQQEKLGQKSVVMKIGKKMIKILNPYKNITEGKDNQSIEKICASNNPKNRENIQSTTIQNNCFASTQITPKKIVINSLDNIEEVNKDQDQNQILNKDQDNLMLNTPSKLKQNPFYFHYNQLQQNQKQKDKIRDLNKKLEILNMNIKNKQCHNFNSEKTTDSSSKENEINMKNAYQTDSNEENTQDDEEIKLKKEEEVNMVKKKEHTTPSNKCNVNKKYLIVKQNKFINQCFQSPFLKPTTVSRKKIINNDHCKLNDILTIMSESQDSFNLDDQMSVIGGNCNNPSFASTIKSIVQEMAV